MWPADNAVSKLNNVTSHESNDSDSKYNSKNGFQTLVWGPPTWMSIHITSFNYPPNPSELEKQHYKVWLESMEHVLPCRYCRENFSKNIKAAGWNYECLSSREMFSHFCYRLHDEVNKMLGKSSPKFEEIRDKYEILRAKCLSEKEKEKLQSENKELGCLRPKHNGQRGKCVLTIVPVHTNTPGFIIDDKCTAKYTSSV